MACFTKDPHAVLDYRVDWGADGWLTTGEEITTSTWVVPTGITKDSATNTTTTATIWLSGGTVGQTYEIVNRISTNQSRTDDRTIRIFVAER